MRRRSRIAAYGSAAALVLAGVASAILVRDGTGQILAFVLIAVGLVAVTGLIFLEVGLSEDRERARATAADRQRSAGKSRLATKPTRKQRHPLGRERGHRRRLR